MDNRGSEYLEWFKSREPSRFNLASSGVQPYPLADLGVSLDRIEQNMPEDSLQEAIAARSKVPPACVVVASGTSMANYLAMGVLVEPGDEILIEHPAYEPLVAVARRYGARIKRFQRRSDDGFRIRPEEVERSVTKALPAALVLAGAVFGVTLLPATPGGMALIALAGQG